MTPKELFALTRGDLLVMMPSHLVVEAWQICGSAVEVKAPRGGRFSVQMDKLEVVK